MSDINSKYDSKFKTIFTQLRYYRNSLPKKDDFVLATIIKYTDVGIFCYLDEYKREAFMSFKDASSSRKLRIIRREVLKKKKYILAVNNVDATKNFIDVEKRGINKAEELEMSDIINFYHRILAIFVKIYILDNLECDISDVYRFLEDTLWSDDLKNIKKNMHNVHTDTSSVIRTYNLDSKIGQEIIIELKNNLERPIFVHNISLKINSISLEAVNDIKNLLNICETTLNCCFKSKSSPLYTSVIKNDYFTKDNSLFDSAVFAENLKENLKKIKSEMKKDIFMDIVNIDGSYVLNY